VNIEPNGPCDWGMQIHYLVSGIFTGLNLLLTTWLTRRAVQKDRRDNGLRKEGGDMPSM
jgi:hypothetical protein